MVTQIGCKGVQPVVRGQNKHKDKMEASKDMPLVTPVVALSRDKPSSSKPIPPHAKPKKAPNRPVPQPRMGRLVNLHLPSKQASFKHTNRAKHPKQKDHSNRAELNLNSSGFYEVAVQYDLCSELGQGCGLKALDVSQALYDDNLQRMESQGEDPSQDHDGPVLDFESEEDLMSDEEVE